MDTQETKAFIVLLNDLAWLVNNFLNEEDTAIHFKNNNYSPQQFLDLLKRQIKFIFSYPEELSAEKTDAKALYLKELLAAFNIALCARYKELFQNDDAANSREQLMKATHEMTERIYVYLCGVMPLTKHAIGQTPSNEKEVPLQLATPVNAELLYQKLMYLVWKRGDQESDSDSDSDESFERSPQQSPQYLKMLADIDSLLSDSEDTLWPESPQSYLLSSFDELDSLCESGNGSFARSPQQEEEPVIRISTKNNYGLSTASQESMFRKKRSMPDDEELEGGEQCKFHCRSV